MNQEILIGSRKKVLPSEVVYFMAESNYTYAFFKCGQKVLVSTNLKIIEDRFILQPDFIRPNRSFFINLNFAEFDSEFKTISMTNNVRINISRRKKANVLDRLNNR